MSIEVNKELGLKFSFASLPSVKFPDSPNSLIHVDAVSGSIILLDGFNYQAERLNQTAVAVLAAGLNNFDRGDQEKIPEQMKDLFIRTSERVAKEAQGHGGINATAVRLVEIASYVDIFFFGHVGRNRIYKLNRRGGYDLITTDAGYVYERHLKAYNEEDRGVIWYLDRMRKEEGLNSVMASPRAYALWSNMLVPPADYLGARDSNIQYGWNGFAKGERLLLSSVGLHRSLAMQEIVSILEQRRDPAIELAEQARERSSQKHFRAAPYNDYAAIVVEKL